MNAWQEPAKKRRSTLAKVASITQLLTPMKTVKKFGTVLQVVFLHNCENLVQVFLAFCQFV